MSLSVPAIESGVHASDASTLRSLLRLGGWVALTGAGVSTDSGIPDYRDDDGRWKHKRPVQFADFVQHSEVRQRYWARSFIGYPRIGQARPNDAHHALVELERRAICHHLITQNVDGLHQLSGSGSVVDLHGRLDRVVCLACGGYLSRMALQEYLAELNPAWNGAPARQTPDGDADLGDIDYTSFRVPSCSCGGVLKPDVVFFGEHVPAERVRRCNELIEAANALLVVGTSLMVFSGYRFVRLAARLGKPVLVINRGRTRADDIASYRRQGNAGELLRELARHAAPM